MAENMSIADDSCCIILNQTVETSYRSAQKRFNAAEVFEESALDLGECSLSLENDHELNIQDTHLGELSVPLFDEERRKLRALHVATGNGRTLRSRTYSNYDANKTLQPQGLPALSAQMEDELDAHTGLDQQMAMAAEEQVKDAESVIPILDESTFFRSHCVEVARITFKSSPDEQRYTKGCLWSPDGTCILVPVHMDGMHVIELPTDLYLGEKLMTTRRLSQLKSAVHVKEGGTTYDCAWYPFMNSSAPESCCWVATRQHEPIHMWDAFDGALRCSYRGYDEVDEVEAAIAVAFSNDGERVFGGYKKSIKIFQTNVPGRSCDTIKLNKAVSCFAQRMDSENFVTVGSWSGNIQHVDTRAPQMGPLFTIFAHQGGVTWLRYAEHQSQCYLYSGARKDDRILKWDMRSYNRPVGEYKRSVATNQRIYFDVSRQNRWLLSGDTTGLLHIWDLEEEFREVALPLHRDCCNGVHIHPYRPIVATSSGQYHFTEPDRIGKRKSEPTVQKSEDHTLIEYENSLILLWVGQIIDKS